MSVAVKRLLRDLLICVAAAITGLLFLAFVLLFIVGTSWQ